MLLASEHARCRELKLLRCRELGFKRSVSVMPRNPGPQAVNLPGCLHSFCQYLGDREWGGKGVRGS